MSKGRWNRHKHGPRKRHVRLYLSEKEFYLFHAKAGNSGGIRLQEYIIRSVHYAIEHRAKTRGLGTRKSQLRRIASLIWGVAAKRYEEYGQTEREWE